MMSGDIGQQAQLANNNSVIAPRQNGMTNQEEQYQHSMSGIVAAWQDIMSGINKAWQSANAEVAFGAARTRKNVVHILSDTANATSSSANKQKIQQSTNDAINEKTKEMRQKVDPTTSGSGSGPLQKRQAQANSKIGNGKERKPANSNNDPRRIQQAAFPNRIFWSNRISRSKPQPLRSGQGRPQVRARVSRRARLNASGSVCVAHSLTFLPK